jgi:hypothetical protein
MLTGVPYRARYRAPGRDDQPSRAPGGSGPPSANQVRGLRAAPGESDTGSTLIAPRVTNS